MPHPTPAPFPPPAAATVEDRLFALSRDLLCAVGSDGCYRRVNPAFQETLGWRPHELLGRPFLDLVHPDDRDAVAQGWDRVVGGATLDGGESRLRRTDGGYRRVAWRATPPDAAGLVYAAGQDVTEHRRAEAALQAGETRYRTLVETAHEGIWVVDAVGTSTYVNARLCTMLGYPAGALLGRTMFEFLTPASAFEARTHFARRQRGIAETQELVLRRHDGAELYALVASSPLADGDGAFAGTLAMVTDITERVRAEAALRESEGRLRHIAAHAPGMLYQYALRPDGTRGFTYVNERALELFDVAPEAIVRDPMALFGLIHPEDREAYYASGRAAMAALTPWSWEGRFVRADGEVRWVQVSSRHERQRDGTVLADGVLVDTTAAHRAAQRMAESEERHRSLFEQHPDAAFALDVAGVFVSANPACERTSGRRPDELVGTSFAPLVLAEHQASAHAHFRAALGGDAQYHELAIRHRAGHAVELGVTTVPIVVAGQVVGVYGIARDLTAQRALEARLRQAGKMEAVGRLAGGVAHDFNNLLLVIRGNLEFVQRAVAAGDPLHEDLDEIGRAADRAAELTRQLLAFGRKQMLQPRRLDVNAVVASVAGMLRRVIGEDIELVTDLTQRRWPVYADPGQLEQVLVNLAVNARDAMPGGGTLRLRTSTLVVGAGAGAGAGGVDASPRPAPGEYVALRVEDTGAGIAPADLPHIFEPFFTTKGVGEGTGLGLATVHGIVEQSGGSIAVESTPGCGTRFTVLLPRADAPDDARASAPLPARATRGGTETILVVEDEASVGEVVRRVLTRRGYTVLLATSVGEALRIAEAAQARGTLDLVLTDVVLPEQSGRALREQLAARWPALRVMYMSGYADDQILQRGLAERGATLLAKPFTSEALADAVRRMLDGAA